MTESQPRDLGTAVHAAPENTRVMYLPRWPSDHHPWVVTGTGQNGIRYSNQEVERDQ